MDQKVREEYVRIINSIWGDGIIHYNYPENINDEVVVIIEDCLNYIREGSKGLLTAHIFLSFFYSFPSKWYEFVVSFALGLIGTEDTGGSDISNWIKVAKEDKIYKTVVVNAASRWRTALQLSLMGL